MPIKSKAQQRYMFLKHPKIAKAWAHGKSSKTGKKEFNQPSLKSLPEKVRKKKK